VYVNPNANSNQGLVNSQTQPITTPITNDANLQGGVIATPEYVANPSDWIIARTDDTPYSKTPGDPIYDTNKKATEVAMIAGYNKTNFYTKSNAPIYKKGNSYITPDMDNHKGNGAWKEANTPEKLNSKSSRNATLDIYFNKIGD
jgi:hypothetical protein